MPEFISGVNRTEACEIYIYDDSHYRYTANMCSCINYVLQNHPLGIGILTTEVVKKLKIKLLLKPKCEIEICCKHYPLIIMFLDPSEYEKQGHFNEKNFREHLYHEFTHLIDRLNPVFKLGLCVDPQSNEEKIWNVYIDGRLWKRGIKVKSFEDYKQLLFGLRLQMGYVCSKAIAECEKVWNAENLTYGGITSRAKKIVQLSIQGV